MQKKSALLLWLIVLVICSYFAACKKDQKQQPLPANAAIVTVKDSLMDGGGVRLFGRLVVNTQISGYGFEYGTDSLFAQFTTLNAGKTPTTSNFNGDILVGLTMGTKYFYRAFKIENGVETDGKVLSFVSQGNKPLMITSISPSSAGMGDTIVIHGKYFDPVKTGVTFDLTQSKIISINDSLITCVIPYFPQLYNYGLALRDNDNTRYLYVHFYLAAPVITSFTTKKFIGDTVQIIGNNFDKIVNFNTEVDFGTVKTTIIATSKTKMTVVVPTIYSSTAAIRLSGQFQTTTASTPFTLAAPTIATVPASSATFSTITITGNNFFPSQYYDYDQVFINGNKANILSADRHSIQLQVPQGPYSTRNASVSVNVLGQTVNYNGYLNITDPWLMISSGLPFGTHDTNSAFVINNHAYCLAGAGGIGDLFIYSFDPSTNTWTQLQSASQLGGSALGVTVSGTKAYIYTNTGFWQYDPASQSITSLAPFIGPGRNVPTMFAIGGSVYLGFGRDVGAVLDFYAYNTSTNVWKQVSGIVDPNFLGVAGFFTIGTKGYAVYTKYNGNALQEYDPVADTWTAKADLPAYGTAIGFSFNGKGYVCGVSADNLTGNCFQYDPVANAWAVKGNVGFTRTDAPRFAFTVGSNSYFGVTDSYQVSTTIYSASNSSIQ